MKRLTSLLVLALVLASPVLAATMGDPLDGNDRTAISVDDDCTYAYEHPACNWCWQVCLYAMMFEDYQNGGITWHWGD